MLIYTNQTYKPLRKSKKTKVKVVKTQKLKPIILDMKFNPVATGIVRRETIQHPSLNSSSGSTTKKPAPQYTGDAMIGIGQLHKSNAVPVFRQQDAEDQSKMRRG